MVSWRRETTTAIAQLGFVRVPESMRDEQQRSIEEAMCFGASTPCSSRNGGSGPVASATAWRPNWNKVVGWWCFHCSHVYVEYDPKIENLHPANHCPGVLEELKKSARERLVKH